MSPTVVLFIFLCLLLLLMLLVIVADELCVRRIRQPQIFYEQKGEDPMADSLTYAIVVTPVVNGDVVSREFSVSVNGEARPLQTFTADTTDFGSVTVPQDSNVALSLVDVDDAGNKSTPAVVEFVAADTIAPEQPGAITVTLVGEQTDSTSAG